MTSDTNRRGINNEKRQESSNKRTKYNATQNEHVVESPMKIEVSQDFQMNEDTNAELKNVDDAEEVKDCKVSERNSNDEENKYITEFDFYGEKYTFKERPAVIEEKEGKIEFRVVNNDNTKESIMVLTGLKNIFQKQLPKIDRKSVV